MLQAMQATGGKDVWAGRRVRFEHGDGLYPDLVPRVKELGIVVVQNPAHLAVKNVVPQFFQGGPLEKAQPLRSLLDAGIPVALGSDGLVNPYLNILFASTHPDRPSEAITRTAIVANTADLRLCGVRRERERNTRAGKIADSLSFTGHPSRSDVGASWDSFRTDDGRRKDHYNANTHPAALGSQYPEFAFVERKTARSFTPPSVMFRRQREVGWLSGALRRYLNDRYRGPFTHLRLRSE